MNADKDYSVVKNIDLVLFALYKCGGAEHLVHTEDVADRVFKYPLGKHRYRWERYLYPDKERVAINSINRGRTLVYNLIMY